MNIIVPFIIAMLVTFVVSPFVINFAKALKLVDNPKMRYHPAHTHKGIIPRAGGLAILIGLVIAIILFSQ